ncbi:MAG TPA: HAD-IIA family hydrolase [Anaerolineales bacterium]|nr:HAD-IIA family hydrolase [Anaerolineales bacterium]
MLQPSNILALILDMDGVLWRGGELLPGVGRLFEVVERRGLATAIATNNATVTPDSVVERLAAAGVDYPKDRVVTSAHAAAGYLARTYGPELRVHVIGEAPLTRALREAGYVPVSGEDSPQAVVVGMDRSLDWSKLVEATLAIRRGAAFIGTNPDRTFPSERGIGPGNGAVLAALEAATGITPIIVGKPEPHLFLEAVQRLGVDPGATLVVGDRLETDILGGRRADMPTALVLTGVTQRDQLDQSEVKPDLVFDALDDLAGWLASAG